MKVLNRMYKSLFYVGITLLILIESYAIGLVFGGAGIALVTAIWSIIKPLPAFITHKMWLLYLLTGAPTGLFVAFSMLLDLIVSKKNNKQDN